MAPEFIASALANGVPRCFTVTAVSVDGLESDRSPIHQDTPRPDARNVVLAAVPTTTDGAGFRFWDDLNGDGATQLNELGLVRSANSARHRFLRGARRDGDLFLTPVRAGTGVEYYDETDPVEDLTSIDFAEDRTYRTTGIEAVPGFGYVFETDGGDGLRALRRRAASARGNDVPDHGLGLPDRPGQSGADRLGRRRFERQGGRPLARRT